MIQSIEYNRGDIQVKSDGHRYVLCCKRTLPNGDKVVQSNISKEPALVKSVAGAVFPLRTRSEGLARFNPVTGCIKWDGNIITPESKLTDFPKDIQAFAKALRTPETIATFNAQKEPEYVMENHEVERIKLVDGVPVLVKETIKRPKTQSVRVKDEQGNDVMTEAVSLDEEGDEVKELVPLLANIPVLRS